MDPDGCIGKPQVKSWVTVCSFTYILQIYPLSRTVHSISINVSLTLSFIKIRNVHIRNTAFISEIKNACLSASVSITNLPFFSTDPTILDIDLD